MSEEITARVPVPIMKAAIRAAEALDAMPDEAAGDPYVAQVRLGWDGPTEFALVPNEFGSYDLAVLGEGSPAEQAPVTSAWPVQEES